MKHSHFEQSCATRAPRGAVRTLRAPFSSLTLSSSFLFVLISGILQGGLERSVASLVRLEALLTSVSVQFLKLHTREAFHVCQSADDFGHVSLALSSRVGGGPTFDVPFGGTLCSLVEGT